ncbi:MAG: protein-L-isoaspartate(D-aspartate) O-methyltransferase [Kofleriaceae bacterium]|nr:protein-L-isoaspartate(D-aspartate) O-methyltransferase [Kofleriaceae bacterium]
MTPNDALRDKMIAKHLRARNITDPRVLDAFARVPRHEFVPFAMLDHAYDDAPLPIGNGQTISQPYVVALTTQALELAGNERVLEVGTGSGYAAAILGQLAGEVETVERIGELATMAATRLAKLGYTNVHVHHGDGTHGWAAHAPYDGIAVAAGAPGVPEALRAQLVDGGRLVLPTGPDGKQHLVRITRRGEAFDEEDLGEVRFVPLLPGTL